jgi:hypothetical protein
MLAAIAGLKGSVTKEIAATIKERRLAMINDLEHLMLLIDADRRGVARLVAEAMQDVVNAARGRIDGDIDARLRHSASYGRTVADRLAETLDRAVERAVPMHRDNAFEFARNDRRPGGARLRRYNPSHLARRRIHALLESDFRVRDAGCVDIRRDRRPATAGERQDKGHPRWRIVLLNARP